MMIDEKTITLNGSQAHYLEAGEAQGKALLLLHGLGTARLNWEAAIPLLAEHYRIIAPDLPGFGASAALPNMRLQDLNQWLKALLDTLDVQQAVVVGNSIGGLVARLFTAGEPQYAPALILVNGGAVPSLPPIARAIASTPFLGDLVFGRMATSQGSVNRMVHVESVKTPDFMQQISASGKGVAGIIRMLARDPMPSATTPPVPTLLLWGADDALATLAEAEKIKASIPGSILSPIADCGHMPQLEAAEVFTWQIHQFLENLSRPPKPESRGAGMLGQRK
jgi:pimeloyl-ACP methyl ester carboxylesterase